MGFGVCAGAHGFELTATIERVVEQKTHVRNEPTQMTGSWLMTGSKTSIVKCLIERRATCTAHVDGARGRHQVIMNCFLTVARGWHDRYEPDPQRLGNQTRGHGPMRNVNILNGTEDREARKTAASKAFVLFCSNSMSDGRCATALKIAATKSY